MPKRRDSKNRVLNNNESQRANGRYMFRYNDIRGERQTIYSWRLVETDPYPKGKKKDKSLREKEAEIQRDLLDGIDTISGKTTVSCFCEKYLRTKRRLKSNSLNNYNSLYRNHIKNSTLGEKSIEKVKKSDILTFYSGLSEGGLSNGSIRNIHSFLSAVFRLAVEDDCIRKNPCKDCHKEYPYSPLGLRESLTVQQQKIFLDFVKEDKVYAKYLPIIKLILSTGMRLGEVVGLTWRDIDLKEKTININHQLRYQKENGIYRFIVCDPKSECGKRTIPITTETMDLLQELKERTYFTSVNLGINVDGYDKFVFLNSRNTNLIIPRQLSDSLSQAGEKYNKKEMKCALKEDREPELLPHISSHVIRHTGCTRMAEAGIDVKVLQIIMGHSNAAITMNIYNHADLERTSREVERLEPALLLG